MKWRENQQQQKNQIPMVFAFKGEGHVRMSFCVPEEEINKAFDRMEEYFSSW